MNNNEWIYEYGMRDGKEEIVNVWYLDDDDREVLVDCG